MHGDKKQIIIPLRQKVYDYLKKEVNNGNLSPGVFLDLNAIGKDLGLSRTPLRDALLRLEAEGFVTIHQRRGVLLNPLDVYTIRNAYQIIGALESAVILEVNTRLGIKELDLMKSLSDRMQEGLEKGNFDAYYQSNLDFHSVFLDLSGNSILKTTVTTLKERLYDFPRPSSYLREWEEASIAEHRTFTTMLDEGRYPDAAQYIRDVHWSFDAQERYIMSYYFAQSN